MGKAYCRKCHAFLGFIHSDGSMPWADQCPSGAQPDDKCPVLADLQANAPPKQNGYDIGHNASGPNDEDAGGYQSIARRCLEDQD